MPLCKPIPLPAALAMVLICTALGCGPKYYPVTGKVTLPDGRPVPGSMVIFEGESGGKSISARGEVGVDGSYSMSTNEPGDGVPAGRYKVSIAPPPATSAEGAGPSPFNAKYSRVESSNLVFEVKPGKNDFPIPVSK